MQKNDLREKAIKAINDTIFYPNKGKERLLLMVEDGQIGASQWQRVWGYHYRYLLIKKQKNP